MNLIEHAKREFEIIGWPGDCGVQEMICNNILELLEVFSNQGHSGLTAPYTLNIFNKLARFETISPLTGEDDEWIMQKDNLFQNKRESSVFKNGKDGQAYWIEGRLFQYPDGNLCTNANSRVDISFPWMKPKPEIIDVNEEGEAIKYDNQS